MAYRILYKPSAAAAFDKLPRDIQTRLKPRIQALVENPRPHGVQKLQGQSPPLYRIRVGDYRVVYEIENDRLIILVVVVGNRRDIYRGY